MPRKPQCTRAERNDPRQWAATSGGRGGNGTPTISDFMRPPPPPVRGTRRSVHSYRAARREVACLLRRGARALVREA